MENNHQVVHRYAEDYLKILDPAGQLNLSACLQCARCSAGCTMREETDVLPHQLNRMAVLGLQDKIAASKAIWLCVSCQTCFSRCPMSVNTPLMIDRVRAMTKEVPREVRRIRIFNEAMLASVKRFGRAYELLLMAIYKLRTGDLLTDIKKAPKMLTKGKFAILPPKGPGGKAVAALFEKARTWRSHR